MAGDVSKDGAIMYSQKSEKTCPGTKGADVKKQGAPSDQEPQRSNGYEINSWCKLKSLILVPRECQLYCIHSFTKYWLRASCIPSAILYFKPIVLHSFIHQVLAESLLYSKRYSGCWGTFLNKRHNVPDIVDFPTGEDKTINR